MLIPEQDPLEPEPYPGGISPGKYTRNEVVELLRQHASDPEVIRFIADMLEE